MIFDAKAAYNVLIQLRAGKTEALQVEFLELCEDLIGVIVSRYDPQWREDLQQECRIRILHAVNLFEPGKGHLHKYLTSVISNTCNTYITGNTKHVKDNELQEHSAVYQDEEIPSKERLSALIARNRARFKDLPVELIDEITVHIYESLLDDKVSKTRWIVTSLCQQYDMTRQMATTVYHSSLIFLRSQVIDDWEFDVPECDMWTLLCDMEEHFGKDTMDRFRTLFSGMYIKVP